MQSVVHIALFGSQAAREQAKNQLENQPDIKRIDSSTDAREIRLLCQDGMPECRLIALLSSSGIDGFKLLPASDGHSRSDQKS